jgi:acyl-CoA reductase-like NAD-dependent aldehyde dehydrogenase
VSGLAAVPRWRERANDLEFRTEAFSGGRWRQAVSGRTFRKTSPTDGALLADVAECDDLDVEQAVAAAHAAFDAWSRLRPEERKRVLLAFAEGIGGAREELALTTVLEVGRPISAALAEVDASAQCIAYYAEAIDKIYGQVAPTDADTLALITREPVGVVGAVVPWNFPLQMAAWKVGPALAAGNCVILKPAEQSPLGALRLAEIAAEAGLPAGVLNVLPGFGPSAGAAIGRHPGIAAVTFTGSTEVGKLFLSYAAASNMKSVSLECGGKSPNVILADYTNLPLAAQVAAEAICTNSGQSCIAGSRLIIPRSLEEEIVELLRNELSRWRPADPFEPETKMGTLVDKAQLDRVLAYIELGQQEGSVLASGGQRLYAESGGLFVEPALFTEVDNGSRLAREEVFGPVLATIGFDEIDEAITLANDTSYGLAAGIWTSNVSTAHRVARSLRAGVVYVNCYDRGELSVPFGGYNESGIGVDKSLAALEKYTRTKATWFDLTH